ncbi:MAG: hypothetical protein ABR973_06240 [Candidatus Acidiferrales bacterium]|jgi:hypothetical protein
MKTFAFFALGLVGLGTPVAFSQSRPVVQQAGDCSVNITGNNNTTASLVCNGIDQKLAQQIREIVSSSRKDGKTLQDISQKLDLVLQQIGNIPQKLPPRRIPPDKRDEIVALLGRRPAKASVVAIADNAEAFDLAQDLYDVLKAAGWTMVDETVSVFMVVGRPERGMMIKVHGETVPPGVPFQIPNESPGGTLLQGLQVLNMMPQVNAQRYPDMPENEVRIEVLGQPEN